MTTNRSMTATEEKDWSFQCRDIFSNHNTTYTYSLTNAFVQFSYAIGIINCSAVPPTIVCNLILIVAICMNKRLQTKTNYVILSLLVSNLLVGLFSLPSHGAFLILVAMRISNCALRAFTSIFSSTVAVTSILLTILLSYERYTALKKPFFYASTFTNKKVNISNYRNIKTHFTIKSSTYMHRWKISYHSGLFYLNLIERTDSFNDAHIFETLKSASFTTQLMIQQ